MTQSTTAEVIDDTDIAARDQAFDEALAAANNDVPEIEEEAPLGSASDGWRTFALDIWITDLNSYEFGIYRHSRNRAKTRQFSSDMDIIAEVKEDGRRTGVVAYREDLWKQKSGMDRRLVLRLFSDKLNWRATMDLLIGRSLQLTVGARGIPITAYAINLHVDKTVIYLERSANKWPVLPENFSFFVVRDGKPFYYRLRHDFFSVGGDYTLYDEAGRKVGHLDGRLFSLGGYWTGKVRADHADNKLMSVMKLFAASVGFNSACRRHIKRLWKDLRAGKIEPKLERYEAEYYLNPRRVR
ncbi:MAG: hypothetical protein WBB38_00510 [Hyphomicrobiaceae bacterium]|jgi:hypothetical protein